MGSHFNAATLIALLNVIDGIVDDILEDTGTTLPTTLSTIDTVVDGIQTDLSNTTDGLGALKTLIDILHGGVEGIQDIKEAQDAELDTARGKKTITMDGNEQDLYGESSDTEFRLEEFRVDLHNMEAGDTIIFKVYTTEDGTERKISDDTANTFTGAQTGPPRVEIIGSANQVWGREDISVTAEQTGVTNSDYREIVCYWRDSKRGG